MPEQKNRSEHFKRGMTSVVLKELRLKAARYDEMKEIEELRPFVDAFLHSLGTLLAYTPMDKWPTLAVMAFDHTAREFPLPSRLYRERSAKILRIPKGA